MKYKKRSLRNAYLLVRSKRPFVFPNSSFFQQLIDYEKKLFKKTTVRMISYINKKGQEYRVPDFVYKMFPDEIEKEQSETLDSTLAPLFARLNQ